MPSDRISGELSLAHLAAIQSRLIAELEAGRGVTLDLADVTGVDVGGLQLLCAAQASFAHAGLCFALENTPEIVRSAARKSGFAAACRGLRPEE